LWNTIRTDRPGRTPVGERTAAEIRLMTETDHNCDDALADLYGYLDGELNDVVVARVEEHLQHCSPCLEAFDFEAELRRVVSTKCRDRMPDDMRAKIFAVIERLESGDQTTPAGS